MRRTAGGDVEHTAVADNGVLLGSEDILGATTEYGADRRSAGQDVERLTAADDQPHVGLAAAHGDVAAATAAGEEEDVGAGGIARAAERIGKGLARVQLKRQRAVIGGRYLKNVVRAEAHAGDVRSALAGKVDRVADDEAGDGGSGHRGAINLQLAAIAREPGPTGNARPGEVKLAGGAANLELDRAAPDADAARRSGNIGDATGKYIETRRRAACLEIERTVIARERAARP